MSSNHQLEDYSAPYKAELLKKSYKPKPSERPMFFNLAIALIFFTVSILWGVL